MAFNFARIVPEEAENKEECGTEALCTEMETSVDQENTDAENIVETSSNDDLLDQITVPFLAPEERIISAVACNGGVSYTTVAPSELGAVPEEDEEAATSSTPSTVVSFVLKKSEIETEAKETLFSPCAFTRGSRLPDKRSSSLSGQSSESASTDRR